MMLKIVLVIVTIVLMIGLVKVIVPKVKLKYRLHKEIQEKKKRQEAFKNKMKELEIK